MNERTKFWLVEFSNGERIAYVGRYEAWQSGAEYIRDTYNTLIAEAKTQGEKRLLKIEGLKALTEFKAASARRGDFECDCLVRVTEVEVY